MIVEKQGKKQSDLVKSTILLNRLLKQHLAVAAIATGQDQSEIMRDALEDRLIRMGCDLTAPPRLPEITRVAAAGG